MRTALRILTVIVVFAAAAHAQSWQVGKAETIDAVMPARRPSPVTLVPTQIVILDGRPVLGAVRGLDDEPMLDLWRGDAEGRWRKLAQLSALGLPSMLVSDGAVGVVSSAGEDVRGGYGNDIVFRRVTSEGEVTEPVTIAEPAADSDRLTVSGVTAAGKVIDVFLLYEQRGRRDNTLLHTRSTDGGRTWLDEPTVMDEAIDMHEDISRLGVFRVSADHFGRFVVDGPQPRMVITTDGGKTWTQRDVQWSDDMPDSWRRLPLRVVGPTGDGRMSLFYLATMRDPERGGVGRYMFTTTDDLGKTWSAGVPVTPQVRIDDPSTFINAAGRGEHLAMTYVKLEGPWQEGGIRVRLAVSADGGRTWSSPPVDANEDDGAASMWATVGWIGDPSRLLFARAVAHPNDDQAACVLKVQSITPPR